MEANDDGVKHHHEELMTILVPLGFTEVMGRRGFFSHPMYGLFDFSATKADLRTLIGEVFKRGVITGRDQIREQFHSLMAREL